MEKENDSMMKNIDRKLNILLGTFVIFVCILIFTSLQNGKVTCKFFIPNIYMYVILAILIIGIITLLREKYITPENEKYKLYEFRKVPIQYYTSGIGLGILGLIVLFIYYIFGMSFYQNHILNHFVWFIVLFGIASLFYPLFKLRVSYNYMDDAAIYVIVLFIVMSGIIYFNASKMTNMNNRLFNLIGMGLLGGLLTIIIASILLIIFGTFGLVNLPNFISVQRFILYAAIFIFSLFISYDTIYILKRNKNCDEKNPSRYPNYPMESFMIFIDLYNIFADLLHLEVLGSINISG